MGTLYIGALIRIRPQLFIRQFSVCFGASLFSETPIQPKPPEHMSGGRVSRTALQGVTEMVPGNVSGKAPKHLSCNP